MHSLNRCSNSFFLQKEHEESLLSLKKQLEDASLASVSRGQVGAESETVQLKLTEALAEVSCLKSKLESVQNAHQDIEVKLEAVKKSKADLEMAAASAAGPDAVKALAEKQAICDERDRAVAKLASQTQAWSVEREQLKKDLEQTKSDFELKLAAASKATTTAGADAELAARLDKLDSILKASIKTGDLRGNAVTEVGKVGAISPGFFDGVDLFMTISFYFSSWVKRSLWSTKI